MPVGVYPRVAAVGRFWAKVDKGDPGECWAWRAHRNPDGYGRFAVTRTYRVQAHRFAYEQLVGPIPDGMFLDHLCRNPGCVNPAHMEPVTNRENILRGKTLPAANAAKTHCVRGHAYLPENTRVIASGARECRACDRQDKAAERLRSREYVNARKRASYARRRAARLLDADPQP